MDIEEHAEPISPELETLPAHIREIVLKARRCWLKNTECVDLLTNHLQYGLLPADKPPHQPPGERSWLLRACWLAFLLMLDQHEGGAAIIHS